MIWFSQRSRIVFCSFHAIFCPLCINIFWIFCSMSHIQGFECCSDRIGDITTTVPFLAGVPSRCSRDLHPYALSSVITPFWGTECILLSPTTLGPIVCFPCLLALSWQPPILGVQGYIWRPHVHFTTPNMFWTFDSKSMLGARDMLGSQFHRSPLLIRIVRGTLYRTDSFT